MKEIRNQDRRRCAKNIKSDQETAENRENTYLAARTRMDDRSNKSKKSSVEAQRDCA